MHLMPIQSEMGGFRSGWAVVACALAAHAAQDSVTIQLHAPWQETPFLLEASELFGYESSSLFWKFVDECARAPDSQDVHALVDTFATESLPPLVLEVFRGELQARAASVAVEAQLAVARDQASICASGTSQIPNVFVEINGVVACNLPDSFADAGPGTTDVYDNDHLYPLASGIAAESVPTVVLYGALGTSALDTAHRKLKAAADAGKIQYVLRHHHVGSGEAQRLSGFGVELDVKKMDYVVKDDANISDDGTVTVSHAEDDEVYGGFNFKRLRDLYPKKTDELEALKTYIKSTTSAIRELKVWELQDIGLQAASRIMRASDPAATLQDVSQNFPVLASVLVHETVNADLRQEADFNRESVLAPIGADAGGSIFVVNGRMLDAEKTDLYSLLSTLRGDAKLLNGLQAVGFPPAMVPDVMSLTDNTAGNANPVLDFRHSAVQFMNNLERDPQYKAFKWSSSLTDLLRPAMPGTPRYIAKNMWNAVFVVDPASPAGTSAIAAAAQLIKDDLPVRFGFLFTAGRPVGSGKDFAFSKDGFSKSRKKGDGEAGETSAKPEATGNKAAVQMIRAYSYISKEDGTAEGFAFLTKLAKGGNRTITTQKVKTDFVKLYGESQWSALLKGEPKKKHDALLRSSEKALNSFGLSSLERPILLINGEQSSVRLDELDVDDLNMALSQHMMEGMMTIQRGLYYGQLPQDGDVLEYIMAQPTVAKRLNSRVTKLDGPVLDFSGIAMPGTTRPSDIPLASLAATAASTLSYFEFTATAKPATFWVVGDFDTAPGQRLAFEALRRQLFDKKSRVAFIHNGLAATPGEVATTILDTAAVLSKQADTGKIAVESMGKLLAAALNGVSTRSKLLETIPNKFQASIQEKLGDTSARSLSTELCDRALHLLPGASAVVVNGRIVGPLDPSEYLVAEDYKILDIGCHRGVPGKMLSKLAKNKQLVAANGIIDSKRSDFVMAGSALLQGAWKHDAPGSRRLSSEYIEGMRTTHVGIELGLTEANLASATQYHDILLIVDPLSKAAQHAVPLVRYLATMVSARARIVLNPVEKISEAPLKRFYRTVLPVTTKGGAAKQTAAVFTKLPTAPLLTLGMHVPSAWLVQAFQSPYDLDNIHLESTTNGVHAIFKLENILLEGRSYEDGSYQPTPGLQLQLNPIGGRGTAVDTLVMANLGYFQLKANPGVWQLGIRPGRSLDVYDFHSIDDVEVNADSQPKLVLNSFSGKNVYVTMTRRPGMEKAKLLSTGEDVSADGDGGLWDSLSGLMGKKKETAGTQASDRSGETINVFSLASGHLYERFLKIMMLSVLKNTKNPVKFWFLKNCMSPQLQEFLPHFAAEYGFSYELVQYKWPAWLNIPPTKHRQIWGYKILFLDTLFPLDVNKIIFVDADQVVRADLKELIEIDLEGAPYGYTPFCSDRKEMDGFRFWNSGYWKGHLDGRPYHISALYVVDLIRFRQLAAGDRLREQYQGLSRDPNSLSNLDQDLPNNMVHQVPIKSLPQEWLWCETWCSDDIKPAAKTIDLCNNPLTKEPKLEAAVRIVSEWSDLDAEAKNVTIWVEQKLSSTLAEKRGHASSKDEL